MLTKCGLTLTEVSRTNWSGSLTGSDRSNSLSVTLKIAVFAPTPSASVSTATSVKPGLLSNIRMP